MLICCFALTLSQSGTRDRIQWIYIFIITIIMLLKIMITFHNKEDKIQNISEDIWLFPNKQLLSNAVLQNSVQGAIIEFSGSTPEQWTEQRNKMPKANESLVVETPVGCGIKYWEHYDLCLNGCELIYLSCLGKTLVNFKMLQATVQKLLK